MASRGKPSKGCDRCRGRKIKCDEIHPICQRCSKGNHECVYRDNFDVFLRNQTDKIAEKAQKKWRSRATKKRYDDEEISPNASTSTVTPEPGTDFNSQQAAPNSDDSGLQLTLNRLSVTPNCGFGYSYVADMQLDGTSRYIPSPSMFVTQPLAELAHQRFQYDFIVPADPVTQYSGFHTFLPGFYDNTDPIPCLEAAFSAAALANFGGRCKSAEASSKGVEVYTKALKLVGKNLERMSTQRGRKNMSEKEIMETLASTCLLGVYELMTSTILTQKGSWTAHVDGAVAQLNSSFSAPENPGAFHGLCRTVCSHMLINRLSMGEAPTISTELYKSLLEPGSVRAMILAVNYETAVVCAEWTETKTTYTADEPQLSAKSLPFIQKFQQLEAQLDTWMQANIPADWAVEKINAPERGLAGWLNELYQFPGAPTIFHRYENFYLVHRWMTLRATRIVIVENTLSAVNIQVSSRAITEESRQYFISLKDGLEVRLLNLVDEVCEAVYSALTLPLHGKPEARTVTEVAGVRGYSLLWPLYKAGVAMRRASLQQHDVRGTAGWIRRALQFAANDVGIGKAQAFLDNIDGKYGNVFL